MKINGRLQIACFRSKTTTVIQFQLKRRRNAHRFFIARLATVVRMIFAHARVEAFTASVVRMIFAHARLEAFTVSVVRLILNHARKVHTRICLKQMVFIDDYFHRLPNGENNSELISSEKCVS